MENCKVLGLTATPYRLHVDGFGGAILKFPYFIDDIYKKKFITFSKISLLQKINRYFIKIHHNFKKNYHYIKKNLCSFKNVQFDTVIF
jgi:hypothetical protein